MIKENFENAIPLKDQHFPKSFFKYPRLSKRHTHIIVKGGRENPETSITDFLN